MGETRQRKGDIRVNSRKEKVGVDQDSSTERAKETSTDNKTTKKVSLIYVWNC